jgi:hypothetical protein
VGVLVRDAQFQPVAGVSVGFEILENDNANVKLLNASAVTADDGTATAIVATAAAGTFVTVRAEVPGEAAIDIDVGVERAPTPIDGEYAFTMQLEPTKLLEKPAAIVVDDVSRALIDPVTFVLDGILVLDDNGNVERHGLCEQIAHGPDDIRRCVRDVGALLNALFDLAIAQVADPATVRRALSDAGLALKLMQLGGRLTLRTEEMKAGPLEGQLTWDRVFFASGATLDLRAADLGAFSAVMQGNAVERTDGSGADFTLDSAKVQFAYAELALGIVERVVLPKLLPSFDTNTDQVVTLTELFSRLTRCDALGAEKRAACEATAPALATLISSGLLPRLSAELPKGFDVRLQGSLTVTAVGAMPTLDASLVFAGVGGQSQTVPLH